MLIKNPLKDLQCLTNQRSILLADQTPKGVGGELRARIANLLAPHIVTTQWGDGQGAASCEMAHMALEAVGSAGSSLALCCIRIFVDVVQAFPSVVVALSLPLPDRAESTRLILKEAGFGGPEVEQILEENRGCQEMADISEHLQVLMANFQEDQWLSSDFAEGVMASEVVVQPVYHWLGWWPPLLYPR